MRIDTYAHTILKFSLRFNQLLLHLLHLVLQKIYLVLKYLFLIVQLCISHHHLLVLVLQLGQFLLKSEKPQNTTL